MIEDMQTNRGNGKKTMTTISRGMKAHNISIDKHYFLYTSTSIYIQLYTWVMFLQIATRSFHDVRIRLFYLYSFWFLFRIVQSDVLPNIEIFYLVSFRIQCLEANSQWYFSIILVALMSEHSSGKLERWFGYGIFILNIFELELCLILFFFILFGFLIWFSGFFRFFF